MVSPSFDVGDTEPSQATRRDEGSARRDDLLPQTGLRDPSARADQKGDRIRQIASLGLHRVRSLARRSSRGSAPIAVLRLLPSENRSPHQGAPGEVLHDR
jgi:hypothetical protein